KLADGERIIAMLAFDPRVLDVPAPSEGATEAEPPYAIAVTRSGQSLRFSLRAHREPSTKTGRRFARLGPDDEVLYVAQVGEGETIACVTARGQALLCLADEVSLLSGPGK